MHFGFAGNPTARLPTALNRGRVRAKSMPVALDSVSHGVLPIR